MGKKKKTSATKSIIKEKNSKHIFWMNPNRLLGLSDGVIAIAVTILTIKLIPILHEHNGDLGAMNWDLYQYSIGFLSLGIYWMLHHHLFHFIKKADGALVWLNLVFLAFASLVPFWVAFISVNNELNVAAGYNGIAQLITVTMLLIIWFYATTGQRLVYDKFDKRIPWGFSKIIMIGIFIIAIGVIGGLFYIGFYGLLSIVAAVWFVYYTAYGYKKYYSYLKDHEAPTEKQILRDENETKDDKRLGWVSPERILVLTDGVIAIAITLMVLELHIPNLREHPNGLWDMGNEFFLIGIGFLALGLYWALHNLIFQYIKRADGILLWLNILFLAFASLVPFWVVYINVNDGSDTAMTYYSVAMLLTLLALLFIWLYASSQYRLLSKKLEKYIVDGYTKFLAFIFIFTIIILSGNILIPGFKYGSWIVSSIIFIYLTAVGYKRFIISEKVD
jgi:uncharacterized membrane protein